MINNDQISPNSSFSFTGNENNTPQRIDKYLTEHFRNYSRSFFQKLIEKQHVRYNNAITTKASTIVNLGDMVTITFPAERVIKQQELAKTTMGVSIISKTEHFMIIYKPAHLLVHAPSKNSPAITLIDWIFLHHSELAHVGIIDRPGIVHRLDKETSGIMIITRTNYAHNQFNSLFKNREIHKTYFAFVEGHPERERSIHRAIGRDPIHRIKMAAFDETLINENNMVNTIKVRNATTHYKVIQYFENMTLIEVKPTTGRTHQIRVHMKSIGHPIVGDQLYGQKSPLIDRQALHAYSLSFTFDGVDHTFKSPFPSDFQHLLSSVKKIPALEK